MNQKISRYVAKLKKENINNKTKFENVKQFSGYFIKCKKKK